MSEQKSPQGCEEKTLNDVEVGSSARVKELRGEPVVCQRLREMGFCEYAEVHKVSQSTALICKICDSRVALSKSLAKNIIVDVAVDTIED